MMRSLEVEGTDICVALLAWNGCLSGRVVPMQYTLTLYPEKILIAIYEYKCTMIRGLGLDL